MSNTIFRTTSELFERCSRELRDLRDCNRKPLRPEELEAAEALVLEAVALLKFLQAECGGAPETWVKNAQTTNQFFHVRQSEDEG